MMCLYSQRQLWICVHERTITMRHAWSSTLFNKARRAAHDCDLLNLK